ncbi:prepilin-type N-terminal cleavage/methylation domain-containing protein [Clostridium tetani]|uniref:Type II secretion system protein n=1 Tax=Clostridium tetani TaxID=1513 RepID=A0A4Q0VF90_CLOTA|nr:prepilin-type N-terminal cleavage/methylation domain-containing protein [Clostridium tetani]RXI45998.1 type II secretion system protein [Clostridium tetani]RXI49447.1 type II secretion system protein [Clostridium tetani]RXM57162.1 type II secretion system protein [Clostridium tetani]RXM61390.1 type II secretion system protein [Clostridium tetani]RXM70215.1 type II secretion system protein [Clostridium tetani]
MFKLNKRGFTLIEVLCAVSVFLIFTTLALSIFNKSIKVKKYNNYYKESIYFIEAIKNTLVYNSSSEEINKIKDKGSIVILEKDMNIDNVRNKSFLNTRDTSHLNYPYIVLNIEEREEDFLINIKNHFNKNKEISMEFYKEKER